MMCFKKKSKIQVINPTPMNFSNEEIRLFVDTVKYVEQNTNVKPLFDPYLNTYVKERIAFWVQNKITDRLHINCLGHQERYIQQDLFDNMCELTNYFIYDDLNAFIKSKDHNDALISGKWKYISVGMLGNWCIIALAN